MKNMDTRVALPEILAEMPENPIRNRIIILAKRGVYHDFLSSDATPKMNLAAMLTRAFEQTKDKRYKKLADDARNGRFDDDYALFKTSSKKV